MERHCKFSFPRVIYLISNTMPSLSENKGSQVCHLLLLVLFLLLYGASREVGKAVGRIIALALDLDANFFDKPEMLGEPIATLRLLHYEGIKSVLSVHYTSYNYKSQNKLTLTIVFILVWLKGQTSNPSQGLYGAGAHTDYGLITLLATDDVPGLQVRMFLSIDHIFYLITAIYVFSLCRYAKIGMLNLRYGRTWHH